MDQEAIEAAVILQTHAGMKQQSPDESYFGRQVKRGLREVLAALCGPFVPIIPVRLQVPEHTEVDYRL